MKKIIAICLILCMALGLVACGGPGSTAEGAKGAAADGTTAGGAKTGVFMTGFGMRNITPKDSVPLDSYGDARDRMSTGIYTYLEARSVAVQDEEGGLLIFATGDVSWAPKALGSQVRTKMSKELNIPQEYIILSGTHTHSSVATGLTDIPSVAKFNEQYVTGMCDAIRDAVADLKPTEVYIGSAMTENMNQVRRYIMDDGSLDGDNAYGTGTKRVAHETEADRELQIMRFVREGGKDILISNFQAHPHLEGKTTNISAQTVGAIRDAVEKELDAHALHWNGAAGNLNTHGSLEGELTRANSVKDLQAYGEKMVDYIKPIYDNLTKVETGPVKVMEYTLDCPANHVYDSYLLEANMVVEYFKSGHTAGQTATYAHQLSAERGLEKRINSYYHANRIVGNSQLGSTVSIDLAAWSFGQVSGFVNSYEMFDITGMYIKENSPFAITFVCGYSYPGGGGYIPAESVFMNGGYEADNCKFAPGSAELIADKNLEMLNDMFEG